MNAPIVGQRRKASKTRFIPEISNAFFSTKSEGTGLGLAIVKRIVEAHSGQLLIESSQRQGTIFSVQLPLKVT